MTIYPYLNTTANPGVFGLAQYANSVTDGYFWTLILFGFFIILFFAFKAYPTPKAFSASSFITMILTILMGSLGLISSKFIIGSIILAAMGLIWMFFTNRPDYG